MISAASTICCSFTAVCALWPARSRNQSGSTSSRERSRSPPRAASAAAHTFGDANRRRPSSDPRARYASYAQYCRPTSRSDSRGSTAGNRGPAANVEAHRDPPPMLLELSLALAQPPPRPSLATTISSAISQRRFLRRLCLRLRSQFGGRLVAPQPLPQPGGRTSSRPCPDRFWFEVCTSANRGPANDRSWQVDGCNENKLGVALLLRIT